MVAVVLELLIGEIAGNFFDIFVWYRPVWVKVATYFGDVDPCCDGGFEGSDGGAFFIGVIAKVGMAGFKEDERFEPDFS